MGAYVCAMKVPSNGPIEQGRSTKSPSAEPGQVTKDQSKATEPVSPEPATSECISALSKFDGDLKPDNEKFEERQEVLDSNNKLDSEKSEEHQEVAKEFEPLTQWLETDVLKDHISKAVVSQQLQDAPCVLVASQSGKQLEVNSSHPLTQDLFRRVQSDKDDGKAIEMAHIMFETATLRSGQVLEDTAAFASRVEKLLHQNLSDDNESFSSEEEEGMEFEDAIEAPSTEDVSEYEEL